MTDKLTKNYAAAYIEKDGREYGISMNLDSLEKVFEGENDLGKIQAVERFASYLMRCTMTKLIELYGLTRPTLDEFTHEEQKD